MFSNAEKHWYTIIMESHFTSIGDKVDINLDELILGEETSWASNARKYIKDSLEKSKSTIRHKIEALDQRGNDQLNKLSSASKTDFEVKAAKIDA